MSKITVTFESNEVRDENGARQFVDGLRYDAETRGARNLTFVSVAQPITFADQAALDEYVRNQTNR